ncbi:MAG: DoxX family protein [Saprospiraceae bacterium]|nr:DoxX family protein [Saprospiraceae bacterium]
MNTIKKYAQYLIALFSALSIVLIVLLPDLNYIFLGILAVNLFLSIKFWKETSKWLQTVSSIIIGIVFIYSGFVKAVDPWGSMFKFIDYFEAFNAGFFNPTALYLAILLSALEFMLGFALLFRIRVKIASTLVLLFMLFFTVLTLYLAIENPVPDCGCFGDALIITNWQTFYKNLIIMVFTMIVFLNRKTIVISMKAIFQYLILIIGAVFILGVSIYSNMHLPIIDFREYKVGSLMAADPPKTIVYLTYANKNTGEEEEMLSTDLPWSDSIWMSEWEFKDQRYEIIGDNVANELKITDSDGGDVYLEKEGFQFVMITYYVGKAHKKSFEKLNILNEEAEKAGIPFFGISGSIPEDIETFRHEVQAMYPIHNADETALEAVIRSNPGLLLLKDGVILGKWAWRDLPTFEELDEEFGISK